MRAPVLALFILLSGLLFTSCKKLGDNNALSSVFLDQLSANNQVTPLANEIVQVTSLPTFGSGGIFLSYKFPDGEQLFDFFEIESADDAHFDLFVDFISNVIANEKGDLWVLTKVSLERYINLEEQWISYPIPENRQAQPLAISIREDGSVVCVNSQYVLVFIDGEFFDLDPDNFGDDGDQRAATTASSGMIWLDVDAGVLSISPTGEQQLYKSVEADLGKTKVEVSFGEVSAIQEDGLGVVWFATPEYLLSFDGKNWAAYKIGSDDLPDSILAMNTDSEGNLWILSGNFLVKVSLGGVWESYMVDLTATELASVNTLHVDADGKIWLHGDEGYIPFKILLADND
ncbi:MAG: hypothetical protein GYB31_15760 [Bacteroidetes bacterium]|nr:hypothetical protein [Bacteroidota bacterium]